MFGSIKIANTTKAQEWGFSICPCPNDGELLLGWKQKDFFCQNEYGSSKATFRWWKSWCWVCVKTYVIHLLGTYVTILCNWLILWQYALYLYLGRSRMCLIIQETCCSSLAEQIARHLWTDSSTAARQIAIYRGLMRLDRYYLSRLWEFRFLDLIFSPCLCICVGFLFSQP